MLRRLFLPFAAAAAALAGAPAAAAAADLVFSVTEGVTYQATPKEIRDKFEPLAQALGKELKRNVRVVLVPNYDDVRAGLAKQEYDLAFIHPAHVALAEVKAGRYKSIAWTTGFTEYTVSLMVKPNDPAKTLPDIRGRTLVTPDPDSITAWMVRAMLRAASIGKDDLKVRTTRYQDAVPFYLEHGFADVGATAANAVVKEWTEKGGKVFLKSRSVPIKYFIVSSKVPADEQERIQQALVSLARSDPGKQVLSATGYRGFVSPDHAVDNSAIAWLGL
jgi:ABC-type phosphate/phosphonate transport system substrate-binding protein